ncbi:hypothetical protein VINI7043_18701 [Vibrio nigripulchritudo ATCC 27043]|nr:hypothetical protein VINI7043_18701 [Vibrio nigripulchritudo ATCC 27043]
MHNSPMNKEKLLIPLPSLIHRIGGDNAKAAKSLATKHQCEMKRVRRSRNWQVTGTPDNLSALLANIQSMGSDTYQFVIKKMNEKLSAYYEVHEPVEQQLHSLILQNPNITLSELMERTNCTLAEARLARFEADIV